MTRRLAHRPLAVLLDYDGTLSPIVAHPAHALLPRGTREALARLSRQPGICVGIISGRALPALRRLVGVRGVSYAGNHGLEACGPGWSFLHPRAARQRMRLRQLAAVCRRALREVPGARVEWKRWTFSVHWRQVPPAHRRAFHRALAPLLDSPRGSAVRVTRGKRVVDVRPDVAWDKGRLVAWLLRHPSVRRLGRRPYAVYVGDDTTDEDAFRAVNRLGGASVRVGRRHGRSLARYRIAGSRDVERWLHRCEAWAARRARGTRRTPWTGTK